MDQDESVSVKSPLYLFRVRQPCYSCGMEIEVIAIATNHLVDPEYDDPNEMDGEVCLLSNIASMPFEIMAEVQARHPQYLPRFSQTADFEYLMTVCQCGAHQGDYHVQKAMFNAACYEPETIKVEELPLQGRWEIDCGYSSSSVYEVLIERTIGKASR